MRGLFWVVGVFALAVALSLGLRAIDGYALFVFPPYRIEVSLVLLVILLLGGYGLAYSLTRVVSHTMELPVYVRAFRERQRRDRADEALYGALQAWFEGRFSRAEKLATKAWDLGAERGAVSLVAARAAQRVRDIERRDLWLARAEESNERRGPDWKLATQATRGELLVDDRKYADARQVLRGLHDSGPVHIATLLLLLRAEQALGDWEEVIRIARLLEKRSGLPAAALDGIMMRARIALLEKKAHDPRALTEYWKGIPQAERRAPRLAAAAARAYMQLGDCQTAHGIIEESLGETWAAELVLLYGECLDDDALKRIENAERWLPQRPRDWPLLLTLGRLCVQRELWGKAQSYLEASLSVQPTRTAHIALAQLFDRMGRVHDANRHFRAAADAGLTAGATGEA
jgi:HemY protein